MDLQLKGKRALVTGGSRGIGRAVTLGLARHGVDVVACYQHDSTAAARLRRDLDDIGGGYVLRADVSEPAAVEQLLDECGHRLGGLDIIVNNAGVMSHVPYAELGLDEWHRMIDTNLTAIYLVVRAALPLLSEGSSIVTIGSGLATVGMPARAHYTASKAGVIGLTRSLCKELGPRKIRVNNIAPGIVETDFVARLKAEQRAQYAALSALNRLARPEDVANVVLFLVSDLGAFISGVTLPVDGGI